MPTVIFVSGFVSSHVGHGGNHRAYQILLDLESFVGKGRVTVVTYRQWRQSHPLNPAVDAVRRVRRRLAYYTENPFKVLGFNSYSPGGYGDPDFLTYYQSLLEDSEKPVVCVVEHTTFGDLIHINARHHVPTICCPANLEALDVGASQPILKSRTAAHVSGFDFINEFRVLAQCAERLFISKVEAGLISGLGLPSQYYPYLPTGKIRERLGRIRQERAGGSIEPGLFLMLGSAGHLTTRDSFAWFVANAQKTGLPRGIRVIVGGEGSDNLLPRGDVVSGLELCGWLDQDELDRLLIRAEGVLAPQRLGFGALTRLPEMACAGVPVLSSRHPTFALDVPPGIVVVDDAWEAWCGRMIEVSENSRRFATTAGEYLEWEQAQPRTLASVVKSCLLGIR